jgi:hypothetical protein
MRYRITLASGQGDLYEVVIYRNDEQLAGAANETMTMRQLHSVVNVYNQVKSEMQNQSAFHIKKVEEIPEY